MKIYGLIGYPLAISFSPNYFNSKFKKENLNAEYKLFPLKNIQDFSELLGSQKNICGLNVTIPYKVEIIPFLDAISTEAKTIGAVNTLVFKDNKITGHNTDAYGFSLLLKQLKITAGRALIFGDGGATKAVVFMLNQLEIPYTIVSRKNSNGTITYQDVSKKIAQENNIWINCTPVGMAPKWKEKLPLPYNYLTNKHRVIDLIYHPEETQFLREAKKHTSLTINGLKMLEGQAEKAWELWRS